MKKGMSKILVFIYQIWLWGVTLLSFSSLLAAYSSVVSCYSEKDDFGGIHWNSDFLMTKIKNFLFLSAFSLIFIFFLVKFYKKKKGIERKEIVRFFYESFILFSIWLLVQALSDFSSGFDSG